MGETDDELVLVVPAPGAARVNARTIPRVRLVDGDFADETVLADALTGVNAVYTQRHAAAGAHPARRRRCVGPLIHCQKQG